jgi:hypothetical protein
MSVQVRSAVSSDQPDAERTKDELQELLKRYPPALASVLALDPTLLSDQSYLATYPALGSFLNRHPEVGRNPSFYIGEGPVLSSRTPLDPTAQAAMMWRRVWEGMGVLASFGIAIGLLVWLVRTLVDYRRWSRLAKVQTEAHTKLLDRFTANDDLLAYIQSPAGAKFLQSAPITLDDAPRSFSAPLSRILWSLQGGIVLLAGGIGLWFVGRQADYVSQGFSTLGVLSIALGLGFVISAIISFVICRRLGLVEGRVSSPGGEASAV